MQTSALRHARPRPMSAAPLQRPTSARAGAQRRADAPVAVDDQEDEDEDGDVIDDDDGDDEVDENGDAREFGDHAEAVNRQALAHRHRHVGHALVSAVASDHGNTLTNTNTNTGKSKGFRPTSAPATRPRIVPQTGLKTTRQLQRDRAAVSIAYLKQTAEKKKQRDREFAQELLREQAEYRDKMTQKVEQANKMSAALNMQRTFALAPDRDGLHMIHVVDPGSNDRVISVENFLREFERLASVQIGHVGQLHGAASTADTTSKPRLSGTGPRAASSTPITRKSKLRVHGIVTSRMESSGMSTDASTMGDRATKRSIGAHADRTVVQDELKSVLASTIEMTKVLQDQLHELKLKGWNFSSRSGQAAATRSS